MNKFYISFVLLILSLSFIGCEFELRTGSHVKPTSTDSLLSSKNMKVEYIRDVETGSDFEKASIICFDREAYLIVHPLVGHPGTMGLTKTGKSCSYYKDK